MTIPFNQVYRTKIGNEKSWTIVMGLTPVPGKDALWMWRASLSHPETMVDGTVFEGSDGSLVVLGSRGARHIFEPLTLARFDDMKDDITGFESLRKFFRSDEMLQEWYWDEFANDGSGNAIAQETILKRLASLALK